MIAWRAGRGGYAVRAGAVAAPHRRDADGRDPDAPLAELLERQVRHALVASDLAEVERVGGQAAGVLGDEERHISGA
jgi:hypothetical protein